MATHLFTGTTAVWLLIGLGYALIGAFTLTANRIDWIRYPRWFSDPCLFVSGAILFKLSAGYRFGGPIAVAADIILILSAIGLFVTFFAVAHIYAKNRTTIDDALGKIVEESNLTPESNEDAEGDGDVDYDDLDHDHDF